MQGYGTNGMVHLPDFVSNVSITILVWFLDWDYVVLEGGFHTIGDRRVQSQCLPYNHVKVWEGVEVIHRRGFYIYSQELLLKLSLYLWVQTQRIETPGNRCTSCLVPSH